MLDQFQFCTRKSLGRLGATRFNFVYVQLNLLAPFELACNSMLDQFQFCTRKSLGRLGATRFNFVYVQLNLLANPRPFWFYK
jgi:hypothetical protein